MPRVVSRSAVSTSNNAVSSSSSRPLRVFYCLCGEFILVLDRPLARLPQRQTDDAYVLRTRGNGAPVYKFNVADVGTVFVRRSAGLEYQHRFGCPRCQLLVAYQTSASPIGKADYVYVVYGALSEMQGRVGDAAFGGEGLSGAKMMTQEGAES